MEKPIRKRMVSLLLAASMTASLAGCGPDPEEIESLPTAITVPTEEPTQTTEDPTETTEATEATEAPTETSLPEEEPELSAQQRNSFAMLYHLALISEEIRVSKDNRLMLDDIYNSLINDINPSSIDELTQEQLNHLWTTIDSLMNLGEKRKRLQYLYNQEKAIAIREAIPDPRSMLNINQMVNKGMNGKDQTAMWIPLAANVGITLLDSYHRWKNADEMANRNFLMSGWELDNAELERIQESREWAFEYMVNIVQAYGLDGQMTLNEEAVQRFAEICAIPANEQRLHRLEAEKDTYAMLGKYWLALADCYYEKEAYGKCLDCVEQYRKIAPGIYRKDMDYAEILPKAIVCVQHICVGEEYLSREEAFAEDILENTETEDWSLRYFAAQVYLDLYAKTQNGQYLTTAYKIAYDNVTVLLCTQNELNDSYMAEVEEIEVMEPVYHSYTSDKLKDQLKKQYQEEKKQAEAFNKAQKEQRKTELPPLYEPLALNCDLLFALADEMQITNREKMQIEAILETDQNGVFLSDPINTRYSFREVETPISMEVTPKEMKIPVTFLSPGVEITARTEDAVFDDWVITEVERAGETLDTFYAHVTSEKMKDHKWNADSKLTVEIRHGETLREVSFTVSTYRENWIFSDTVEFTKE